MKVLEFIFQILVIFGPVVIIGVPLTQLIRLKEEEATRAYINFVAELNSQQKERQKMFAEQREDARRILVDIAEHIEVKS